MFLYELAIELGQRSSDVLLAAESLGLGPLTTATTLDAAQVAALRAHFQSVAPTVGPLGGAAPPLPAPDLGPLVAAPPPGPVGRTPQAPASWGPPTPAAAAAAAAAPRPSPPSSVGGGPLAFGPPDAHVTSWPPPGEPVATGRPSGSPAPPPAGATMPGALPPPPSGPPSPGAFPAPAAAPPAALVPPGVIPPPGAQPSPAAVAESAPATGIGGLTKGQVVALAVVGVLVVALFGWMVLNTGPSEAQKDRVEASKRTALEPDDAADDEVGAVIGSVGVEDEPGEGVTGSGSSGSPASVPATTATPTTAAGPDPYEAVDVGRFCAGARGIAAFELRFSAAVLEADRAAVLAILDEEGPAWEAAVAETRAGAPPDNHNDIDAYHAGYVSLFGTLRSADTLEDAYRDWSRTRAETVLAGKRLNDQVTYLCT